MITWAPAWVWPNGSRSADDIQESNTRHGGPGLVMWRATMKL